ncbi:MAG: hypothetical protein KGJ60_01390 [Verrucomicrobiota bacterium]|nr:hypothetical protein [Verrucomicrobiota bacterium]
MNKPRLDSRLLVGILSFAMSGVSLAQTPPAVSGLNGKFDYAGGMMNSFAGHNFDASLGLPVAHQFGFQADGLYSRISNLDFYGGAGHLFWRDPNIGLLGLTGGYLNRNGSDAVNTFQAGVEGAYYLKRFTFGAFAGVGQIKYANPAPFINTHPTRFVGTVSAGFYPIDDLLVSASYMTAFRNNLVEGALEFQTPIRGLALTGEAALGDHGYDHLLFGIRYYFGAKKSLRARHRQDDPPGLMHQILYGLGLYGAEFGRKENAYLSANPGSGSSEGGGYGVITTTYNPPIPPIQVLPPSPSP